ncbi:putative PurR-regulated permease PerM [Nitrosospira sp. Nsp5]|uniref:Predicted PurR-regulated permease PerM n=1 Tax=Nitrosospira multiformis TaxID=1231 RepID=A0ABY0T847_9PROT|nr:MULTISPECIES: AI-2E family transporter YdiK [Nitrosospira]PTR07408.1 putative PurR-regulated permease PerM [Nitrosospira sp. Nsp5]SDQ41786.1 Predicted PurR-regulated permease PerM [Nitrosospira multiformis]
MIKRPDLTSNLLSVLVISLLIAGSLWVMEPFLPAAIWATMIVVATWPIMIMVQRRLGGRRGPAVAVMVLAMTVIIGLPLAMAISTIIDNAVNVANLVKNLPNYHLPVPPDWLRGIPLVGERLWNEWQAISNAGAASLTDKIQPYASRIANWALSQMNSVAMLFIHLLLTLIVSAIFYARGEIAVAGVARFARRLAGPRGEDAVQLAGQSIRAVALGIVFTAIAQSALGGLGLWTAGVPFAGVLTAIMLFFCIIQVGPGIPLLGGVIWLFYQGDQTWGFILLVWAILVGLMDNVLRPVLIRRGANLPILLILIGVLGGILTFGIIGLFIGPVILAVTYTLTNAWIADGEAKEAEAELPPSSL